jgi:hypothetical protein
MDYTDVSNKRATGQCAQRGYREGYEEGMEGKYVCGPSDADACVDDEKSTHSRVGTGTTSEI